ncbi:hypothetical protein PYCC9005_001044 [Savitreella phatthalungensis]
MVDGRALVTFGLRTGVLLVSGLLLLYITHTTWYHFGLARDGKPSEQPQRFPVSGLEVYGLADRDQDGLLAFLGARPDSTLSLDAQTVYEKCGAESVWRDTHYCLNYLEHGTDDYMRYQPEAFCNRTDPAIFHTYWRGPLTWRVALMLKSWLYTQNLACSEWNLWLDCDWDPLAEVHARSSHILAPFLPLVEEGIIRLRHWNYPDSVYVPRRYQQDLEFDEQDRAYFKPNLIPTGPVAVSDSLRFMVLHEEGGLYADMDTIFLRDMRPLMLDDRVAFAERWGGHSGDWEYNTAYLRLQKHSNLSSTIMQAGVRMGMNFHPSVIGKMLTKIGRREDLLMFESALFDPLWTENDNMRWGDCCVPCLPVHKSWFAGEVKGEWSSFTGPAVVVLQPEDGSYTVPNNKTLSNFYRGAFTHHIHNMWDRQCEIGSWCWVAIQTYDEFLAGHRPNPYGEMWSRKLIEMPDRHR